MSNKKQVIKSVVDLFRMENDKKFMVMILTDEEQAMTPTQLKAHLKNEEIKNNNERCDEILKAKEVS